MASFSSFDKLLEAMETIAASGDSKLKYDKTVEMTIVNLVDGTTGEYLVEYQGNKMSAFVTDLNRTYKKGDIVFVKIPEGDFSNTKLIEGTVSTGSATVEEKNILSNAVIEKKPYVVGENGMYGAIVNESGLISGEFDIVQDEETIQNPQEKILFESSALNPIDGMFGNYGSNYDKLLIQADFCVPFSGVHTTGNYGIKVVVEVSGSTAAQTITEEKTYILDTSSFVGNIYGLSEYSTQNVIVTLPLGMVTRLKSIILFQEEMEIDKIVNYQNSEVIWQNTTTPNILVKNIKVAFCEVIDYTQDVYYAYITTPLGDTFYDNAQDTLELRANFIYKGDNAYDESNCTVYWYKEDYSVLPTSEEYDVRAGLGWRRIELAKEGETPTAALSPEDPCLLFLTKEDVIIEQKYKFVLLYGKEQISYSSVVTIYNIENTDYDNIDIYLEQSGSTVKIKPKSYTIDTKERELVGEWYRLLPDGSYILKNEKDEDGNIIYKNSINISKDLIYQYATYKCKVYEQNGDEYKFIVNKEISAYKGGAAQDELTVSFVGKKSYQYDANGDFYGYNEDGARDLDYITQEKTLSFSIVWADEEAKNFTAEWYIGDEKIEAVSISEPFSPKNSMLQKIWIGQDYVLHYFIKPKYNNNYNNNNLKLIITVEEETKYTFNQDLLFSKTGDPGTNGTSYSVYLRPLVDKSYVDDEGNIVNIAEPHVGFKSYHADELEDKVDLGIYVYKDGERINLSTYSDFENYSFQYKITGENVTIDEKAGAELTENYGFPVVHIIAIDKDATYFVVKVQVTISSIKDGFSSIIYYNYPLSVSFGSIEDSYVDLNIPNFIKYNASGNDPEYSTQDLEFKYGENDNKINYTANITVTEKSESLLRIRDIVDDESNITRRLVPITNFDYSRGAGSLTLTLPSIEDNEIDNYIIYTIMMYLDPYGNENINGWDGTKINIDGADGGSLLAPQVGAGIKNDDNTFTGMVMGKKLVSESNSTLGLFAFNEGVQTFELNADDGSAWFGKNKAITISPDGEPIITGKATTEDATTGKEKNYTMTLQLSANSKSSLAIETDGFKLKYDGSFAGANNRFKVDANGYMSCRGASIGGTLDGADGSFEGTITAEDGKIGGWIIDSNTIKSMDTILSSKYGIDTNRIQLNPHGKSGEETGFIDFDCTSEGYPTLAIYTYATQLEGEDEKTPCGIKIQAGGYSTTITDKNQVGGYIYLHPSIGNNKGYVQIGPQIIGTTVAVFG